MTNLGQSDVYKQNAKTKELREEISDDILNYKKHELTQSIVDLENLTDTFFVVSFLETHLMALIRKHRERFIAKNDEQGIDYSESVERLK